MDSESAMFHAAIAEATVQLLSSEDVVGRHPKCGLDLFSSSPQASEFVRAVLDSPV